MSAASVGALARIVVASDTGISSPMNSSGNGPVERRAQLGLPAGAAAQQAGVVDVEAAVLGSGDCMVAGHDAPVIGCPSTPRVGCNEPRDGLVRRSGIVDVVVVHEAPSEEVVSGERQH
jgi:hypothetical protein